MEKIERLRIVLHDILLYGKRRMRVTPNGAGAAVHDALRHGRVV